MHSRGVMIQSHEIDMGLNHPSAAYQVILNTSLNLSKSQFSHLEKAGVVNKMSPSAEPI